MMGYGGFDGMGGLGWIWMILVWALVVGLVVWGVSAVFSGRRGGNEAQPLEILRTRFARGEIGEAEYEQAKRTLTGQPLRTDDRLVK